MLYEGNRDEMFRAEIYIVVRFETADGLINVNWLISV